MVVLVVLAIACYAMSPGPITWVLLAEIFPNRVRAVAMATCTFALWVGSFTLTYTFPLLNNFLGSSGTFWIYAVICAVGYLFFFRALPGNERQITGSIGKGFNQIKNNSLAN